MRWNQQNGWWCSGGLLEPVFPAGETFPHDPEMTETQAHDLWAGQTQALMVGLEAEDGVVATTYLKPNNLTLGVHVANAGYVVAEHCRRHGIGSRLCRPSLATARRLGYRAMQFNLVVSTNTAGIRCWGANGFRIVGTLPGAFRHRRVGFVDAFDMFQTLVDQPEP